MARDESRVVMEVLAKRCPEAWQGHYQHPLLALDGKLWDVDIVGYSAKGHYGNFGKTDDSFLVVSREPAAEPVTWYKHGRDKVDFVFELDRTVRPWKWYLLNRNARGFLERTMFQTECTIV